MDKRYRAGFTLIELLVVMAIMLSLMGIGAVGYFGIRRGAEMRGAEGAVRTTLMLARQQAVIKRRNVTVKFESGVGVTNLMRVYIAKGAGSQEVHQMVPLPKGIRFKSVKSEVTFYPAGFTGETDSFEIILEETVEQAHGIKGESTITVWPLTGITRIKIP